MIKESPYPTTTALETNRLAWLRSDPTGDRMRVHKTYVAEFRAKFDAFLDGTKNEPPLKSVFLSYVAKAEWSRQLGIVLLEWEETLPGKKLTRDIYEQHKDDFSDARGLPCGLELLEWLMRVAHENREPITDYLTAAKYKQVYFKALEIGNPEFRLECERPAQHVAIAADPRQVLSRIFDHAAFLTARDQFKARYFECGKPKPAALDIVADKWKPFKADVDEFWKELGL